MELSALLFVALPMFLKVAYLYGTLNKGSLAGRKKIGKFYLDCSPYVDPGGNAGETLDTGVGNSHRTEGRSVCLRFVCPLKT
jgi:hypothetical protein